MWYPSIDDFRKEGFPFIHEQLSIHETAPDYELEMDGMNELGKVLTLVQSDEYYPAFEDKAAYIISSIAASQYFSNGNKRLSIIALLLFLTGNHVGVRDLDALQFQALLTSIFPACAWETNESISDPHSLFLYNLAIALGDRTKWGGADFGNLRESVADIFATLYRREQSLA